MKRRDFVKYTGPLSMAPFVLNNSLVRAFSDEQVAQSLNCTEINERVLVLIQLKGGNDGINTIIPVDQYSRYAELRPNIRIPEGSYIALDDTLPIVDQVGLHPAMTEIKQLYDEGKVNIVQSVSYHNHNRSHFKSTDLWMTGGDGRPANFNFRSGWMGRFLSSSYSDYVGTPTELFPDPLGIQLGSTKPSVGFHTESEHAASINLSGQDPAGFYTLISELGGLTPNTFPNSHFGEEMQYVASVQNSTSQYAQRISSVFNNGKNTGTYPNTDLADQLKTVARLLSGGSKSKIFLVQISGFDTHAFQVTSGDATKGKHASLWTTVAEGVQAFLKDLETQSLASRVLTATFSEFGRKAAQNGNFGTDHGTIAPMFLFGDGVSGGVTGTNVDLSDLANNAQLKNAQHDYRQVFTTILQDWLGASDGTLSSTKFGDWTQQKLPLINTNHVVDPSCYIGAALLATATARAEGDEPYREKDSETILFEPPLDSFADPIDEREVKVVWEKTPLTTQYNLRYKALEAEDWQLEYSSDPWLVINDLEPNSEYEYQLKSEIRGEWTDWSLAFFFNTPAPANVEQNKISIKAYPNPAMTELNISLDNRQASGIQVFNYAGEMVMNLKVSGNFHQLDVNNLLPGTYVYTVLLKNKKRLAGKFIKI